MQNSFFVDRKKVYAAENPSTTKLVAIFVDKNIYQDLRSDLVRYTTKYLQQKINNSKAIVLPIDTEKLQAHEISQILENMYFEGLKDEDSQLVGTILIGDIPLPVVESNGFVYPSIYPYVDFENQQFIYDTDKGYFIDNDNPNGQAEIRHSIIKFDKIAEYQAFFDKVKSYDNDPTKFIDKAIRYEDFIGLKKYFIPENTKYYVNNLAFAEDIGYHRFTNLMLNILKDEHNQSTSDIASDLSDGLQESDDTDLQAYGEDIAARKTEADALSQQISAKMPTMTLSTAIQEMFKGYDGLFSSQFLSKIKDNISGLARRYKTANNETFTDYSSLTEKIAQKDNRLLGDEKNDLQPLLIQMNDYLEQGLDDKIADEKYYLTIPISTSKLVFEGEQKGVKPLKKCIRKTYDYYENYFFGKNANLITDASQTNIFRGTFQNLETISGQNIAITGQSIGGSYKIFSTQVEANRGYDINSTQEELEKYSSMKINKQELRGKTCTLHLFGTCLIRKKKWTADESSQDKECHIGNTDEQGGCESMTEFAERLRGGASPMNISSTTQKLTNYDYRNAIFPIYDIAGAKAVESEQSAAYSYAGVEAYTNMIQQKFAINEKQEESNNITYLIKNPQGNGIDLKFTNQLPVGNLNAPSRTYNAPLTYGQSDFFTIFGTTTYHITNAGKAVLYNLQQGNCGGQGTIYTYKTIDSRVKNTSPTRDQISDTEFYKFKDGSDLKIFYDDVIATITDIQTNIINEQQTFSGNDGNDMTGVISNLIQIKNSIISGNNGIQAILSFDPSSLTSYSASQVISKANERSGNNITPASMQELSGRIEKVNEGLDDLTNFMNGLSINNISLAFDRIIQSEGFKNQKVEILDTWKTDITDGFNGITNDVNGLKSTFSSARGIYNTITGLNNSSTTIASLQGQRSAIDALHAGDGCTSTYYKAICDVMDGIIATLQADLAGTGINDRIDGIQSYQGDNNGTPITVQPFVEINATFSPADIAGEISEVNTTMNSFVISTDEDKKEKNKGMNLTTQDRPIDNIRNITFKGIGGDEVRLEYPNLYEVQIYDESDGKLVLKTPENIKEAVKKYLTDKAVEYNTLLEAQMNKVNTYSSAQNAAFTFLGTYDALANPHTHQYDLIPTDYFIDKLTEYLDTLADGYGTKTIYGQEIPSTNDEKLMLVAKLLYYQNIERPERSEQSTVTDDLTETKASFDINQKMGNIMTAYLTENNDQGKFITPTYNTTGYEIGYINSDGDDYLSSQSVPAFIQQIQSIQTKAASGAKAPANTFIQSISDSSSAQLQKTVDECEGVDTNGTSLLFDFKTFSSPRIKAMKCRAKTIFQQPANIKISFKNALGPVIVSTLKEIGNSLENRSGAWQSYNDQRTTPDNDSIIDQAPDDIKQKLRGYNTYGIVNIDKTNIEIENTGSDQLHIGMTQDVGLINVKISGTGDNCFQIRRKGKQLSPDICTKDAKEYYDPYTDDYAFDIVMTKKTAGQTAIRIELCPGTSKQCITKQQIINVLPAAAQNISIETSADPAVVMDGGTVPIGIDARDAYGNEIGTSIEPYTINVLSGDGTISNGANASTSITFNTFPSVFSYQAPEDISENRGIQLQVMQGTKVLATKNIAIVQGIVDIKKNADTIYQSDSMTGAAPITFNLPQEETAIQYIDENGIAQIVPENIPSITISVKDRNGNLLDTVANITSENGFLIPGVISKNTVNGNQNQYLFKEAHDFIIKEGVQQITLYPNFKAGNDTITISIPGKDPIRLPVKVNPGAAKSVIMTLDQSKLDTTEHTTSQGTIQVVDAWNNKVESGTAIKIGVIGAAEINANESIVSGNSYTYTITAKDPGGEGYVFAYIKDRQLSDQTPAYQRFIVQQSVLPKEKLNIMYLNLFGTDRGNQRGYFSENEKIVNSITAQSDKVIATTTELIDPTKIKQMTDIITPQGQIRDINGKGYTLTLQNKRFLAQIEDIATIDLGTTNSYTIQQMEASGSINTEDIDKNTIFYIPEATDSIITGNIATKSKITINGQTVMDLEKGTMDANITIISDGVNNAGLSETVIMFNGKTIGKFLLRNTGGIDMSAINLKDPVTYGMTASFDQGSTNNKSIGIYIQSSAFTKQGYDSIEDSADPLSGIGFTSKFKNIANFANGKSVGESTLPYGSQFLINFGDPLLERREKNPEIPDTDFDASIGQTIYADPDKTIFKTIPMDFNNDGEKDLLIVYTDGSMKLMKNHGGKDPYQDMQELMIIAEAIEDVKIGDVDGNGYDDIIVMTKSGKGLVYLNEKGVFPVDGKNICLNTNTETISQTPDDLSAIGQLFMEDMDKDGKLDIVTNDDMGDIKIFYGGSSNGGANYLSSITGTCDSQRYTRQKNNYQIIKRFGAKINGSRYIQDDSLIHRKGMDTPTEGTEEETEEEAPDTTANMTETEMQTLKDQTITDIQDMIGNTDTYIAAGSKQLAYTENPLTTSPTYESLDADQVYYLPTNESNESVSVYKEYQDMNGGILKSGDEVAVKTTILSKKDNNKLTYIDHLIGPRTIAKDDEGKLPSLVFTTTNTGSIAMDRDAPEGYQFVMDNIRLNSGEMLSFSYKITYKPSAGITTISVQDEDLQKADKHKDDYPDITVKINDSCQKNRRILFNEKTGNKRSYEEIYNDIQSTIDTYNSGAQAAQQTAIQGMVQQLASLTGLQSVSDAAGTDTFESRNNKSILNVLASAIQQGGSSINIQTDFIDAATANVSQKLDSALEGLCQGFKVGKNGGCQGVAVPFNQAFLAAGEYHIFGCVPKTPNPLAATFQTLNDTIGKGIPVLTVPGNWPSPVGYLPIPGIFGLPFKGPTDGYFLGTAGGTYTSQFRLYIVPTLTLGLGIAMCFGPYTVGKSIPKPFRDMGGNCIVFALAPLTTCSETSSTAENTPAVDSYDTDIAAAADVGTCNNPPKIGNTIVFVSDSGNGSASTQGNTMTISTASSPLQLVAAGSEENNPHYSAAIPQGNFGGLISIDQDPTRVSAEEDYGNAEEQIAGGYQLEKGEQTDLKILGAKTKGVVKCVVQDRMTRQIQYIQNNLTKMTIQLDLPDISTVFQGFDKIGNLEKTYQALNEQDQAEGYIQSVQGQGVNTSTNANTNVNTAGATGNRTQYLSRQQLENISETAGENPFQAIQDMFKEVPLVNIDTKEINIEVPALTSDDINEYISYLTLRVDRAQKTIDERGDFFEQMNPLCAAEDISGNLNNISGITKQINAIEAIKEVNRTPEQQTQLDNLKTLKKDVETCLKMEGQLSKFVTFRENSAGLIRSIKQNIIVLQKYKEFPTQLYEWTHVTDRYLTELSSLLSDFVGSINNRLDTNATRFSQYVDALTLLVGTIKTWQTIIDFSVNRSEKCSKCSNDNYGSFSCSLSFLCPKLPIFPIPAFKIPNIYMDMSHIELGMNITLPKINFIPTKISLPQIPDLPEPPSIEVNRDILYGLDLDFFKDMSLPTIPVIPEPPTLPEPPSFIPSIKMDLPVLPPAPKIPKILPEINGILKVADFIGKVFCIVKGGIGLVGEKGVKGKVEQLTQRTRDVPVFDFYNLTTKYTDPPLQGFDYKMDAYATLKFNFDGVYDVLDNIAQSANTIVSQKVDAPIQQAVDRTTENVNIQSAIEAIQENTNNNTLSSGLEILSSGLNIIENGSQNININNLNGYLPKEETGMLDYQTAYNKLKQGLLQFSDFTLTDKATNDKVQTILATVENKSTILPATQQIENVEKAAQGIIEKKKEENKQLEKEIQEYDNFIKKLKGNTVLVDSKTTEAKLSAPLMTIDSQTKNILQSQENPTKTYLTLNQQMVDGYLKAVNNESAENLNMSQSTYKKSKTYLQTTKEKIDTALVAYEGKKVAQSTCTNCSENTESETYSTDISAYVQGVFVESYSGTEKSLVNTVASTEQSQNVQKTYTNNVDLNNDGKNDILMYDANTIYIKYADQEDEHLSRGGNSLETHSAKRYSYANEHLGNRYISSLEQLRNNSDAYGYTEINDITVKIVDTTKEVKNFKTQGQSFSNIQLRRKNSATLGEHVDGYVIKLSKNIDSDKQSSSFRDFFGTTETAKYLVALPEGSDYKNSLLTIDSDFVKKPMNLEMGDKIVDIAYYDPQQEEISLSFKDLPRNWLYTRIAALTLDQQDLSANQKKTLKLYKKSSPRSNQTVAGTQNLGDVTAPNGDIMLQRNATNKIIGTGIALEGYINTQYTLKSERTDDVIVARMEIRKNGTMLTGRDNRSQTGTISLSGLFFTGATQESFDFIATDKNDNIAKETVTLNIQVPTIQIVDLKKSGEDTADIIAKISNDLDEGTVTFQRLRNGIRKDIQGSDQNGYGGFSLAPDQTIITGGIFTIGNDIGLYDKQGDEVATIDQDSGDLKIQQGYENRIQTRMDFSSHIPILEVIDTQDHTRLFQIILPVQSIESLDTASASYKKIQLPDGQFGNFNNGYCIMNAKNDCVLYTNTQGSIYIPGTYATSLQGNYGFDSKKNNVTITVTEQSGTPIAKISLKVKPTTN